MFAYETSDGSLYGTYDEALAAWSKDHWGSIWLTGKFYNTFYNVCEPIDELELRCRPDVSQVKQFMQGCIELITMFNR